MEDRFSKLPEHIIHTILSHLTTRDIMNVSFLSKTLMQPWRSLPFINLDETCYSEGFVAAGSFLRLVEYCFQQRQQDADIQKFRIVLNSDSHNIADAEAKIQRIIHFVLARNLQNLELNLGQIYRLPDEVFSSMTIKALTLKGHFQLEKQDIVVCNPDLEGLFVSYGGDQLKTVKVSSSCCRLKNIVLGVAQGLELVEVEAKNLKTLEVFSFCQISASACTNLRNLMLLYATITDISKFKLLRTLVLNHSGGIKILDLSNDYLREVKLKNCTELVKVRIVAPKLRSFTYKGHNVPCTINIKACKSIRSLTLENAHITDGWLQDNLSELLMLETLKLRNCASLNDIAICNPKLHNVEISDLENLANLLIDSQNLHIFAYSGSISPSIFIVSTRIHAKLCLKGDHRAPDWYAKLRHFLVSFACCKELTLDHFPGEISMFPKEERQKMIPPLLGLKNLKISKRLLESQDITNLVDSILWAAPRLETLCLGSDTSTILKLKYSHETNDENEASLCCYGHTCWGHYIEEVSMHNLGADLKRKLHCYFTGTAKRLKRIHSDMLEDKLSHVS